MDIQFMLNGTKFNFRASGICIKDSKILLHKAENDPFWGLIGGKAKTNESTEHAVWREYNEELKVDITVKRLAWVAENFFEFEGEKYQEITFIYILEDEKDELSTEKIYYDETSKKKLIFKWFSFDELDSIDIKPGFMDKEIKNIPEAIKHIVYRDN